MNYFELVKSILTLAGRHKLVNEVFYGDVYEFHNSGNRKYCTFVLTNTNATENGDTTTYTFNAFVTDRLTDDSSNKLEVQSLSKTILEQILAECFDSLDSTTYTFWTEKFNDLCAGCYVTFSVSLPKELICADDELFNKVVKEINENGTYSVNEYDEVKVSVLPTTEERTIDITSNGTYEVTPKDADSISKVTANVDINYEQAFIDAGGKFAYSLMTRISNQVKLKSGDCTHFFRSSAIQNVDNVDFSEVTNASNMFNGAYGLTSFNGNLQNCTNLNQFFYSANKLTKIGDLNTSKCSDFGSAFNYCSALKEVGVIDFSSAISVTWMFAVAPKLVTIGGMLNLGKSAKGAFTIYLTQASGLSSKSIDNIADSIYDLNLNTKAAGSSFIFHKDVYSALTDEQKNKFTAKGWTIVSA